MKLGNRIKALRESQGLLQRQLSAQLEIDTPMFSKMERGERRAQREHIARIATVLNTKQDDLTVLWLADKINDVIQNEPLAEKALKLTNKEIK